MSVGIGVRYSDGYIVCADSKVVLEDGSTKIGGKVSSSEGAVTIAIANASTNDGNAGTTLAREITDDLRDISGGSQNFVDTVKRRMRAWHAGYGSPGARPPDIKFILAAVGIGYHGLYFCEPPQTVIEEFVDPIVVGAGAAVLDPLVPAMFPGYFA